MSRNFVSPANRALWKNRRRRDVAISRDHAFRLAAGYESLAGWHGLLRWFSRNRRVEKTAPVIRGWVSFSCAKERQMECFQTPEMLRHRWGCATSYVPTRTLTSLSGTGSKRNIFAFLRTLLAAASSVPCFEHGPPRMDVLIDLDSIREKQPTTILTCHRTELDWTHNTKIRFTQFHCSRFSTRAKKSRTDG